MAEAPDFPLDVKSAIRECVLALFWPKKKIIEFFEHAGCAPSDVALVKSQEYAHLKRAEIVEAVYYRLAHRPDRGFPVFQAMIGRLMSWSHFDPFWFEQEKKLDRTAAEERLTALRQIVAKRNAGVEARRARDAERQREAAERETFATILADFRALCSGAVKPQQRGYAFEGLLKRLFDSQGVRMSEPFRLVGEQIDGTFKFEGENYIVEAKWQDSSTSTEALYKFAMKADGKLYARGVFVSVNGYSNEAIRAIVHGKHIKTILVDGEDLVLVLEEQITLADLLDRKIRAAQTRGEVYIHPVLQRSKL